jgi:hypothetical protein
MCRIIANIEKRKNLTDKVDSTVIMEIVCKFNNFKYRKMI